MEVDVTLVRKVGQKLLFKVDHKVTVCTAAFRYRKNFNETGTEMLIRNGFVDATSADVLS